MARYPQSAISAKRGINHVRAAVEGAGSLFLKIDLENDLGIDALIELIQGGKPLHRQIAVQIKSGQSYFDAEKGNCAFPIGLHREYWLRYPLPVWGVVYVPALGTAHWVNIKRYLAAKPTATTVRYQASEANRFDEDSFARIILPSVAGETPVLEREQALRLLRSVKLDEAYLGIVVLFRTHPNDPQVWEEFIRFICESPAAAIPPLLVYFVAHIPWHMDIIYSGEVIASATREYARKLLAQLGFSEIVKLLSLIDREASISRGSIGQSVEAIISSLPMREQLLQQVVGASELNMFVRECAALLLAMNRDDSAQSALAELARSGSWYAGELLGHLQEWGHVNPYA